jgi:hypothetical protein
LQGLSDGAAPVAGNERFTRRLEAAPWGARHAVPPHPLLEVGASHDTVDPEGFNVSENCYKCTVETQSAQRFLAIARCVLCREVGEDRASNWYAPRAVGLMEIVKSAPCTVGLMKIEHLFRSTAPAVGLMEIENLFHYTALAVGLMEIEHLFRYPALAVGLKPSAMRGEARLRGLERAVADYLLKDHKPSASQGEARLRGLWRIIYSKTISPRLARAKPACAG